MQLAFTRDELLQRDETRRLGLWMFLATVAMLFAAFTSAYVVRRSGGDWHHVALPYWLWLSTAMLVCSSGAVEACHWWGVRCKWTRSSAAMGAALTLGLSFLVMQARAWQELMRAGFFLSDNPHASFFYMMSGAHAIHVVAALIVLSIGAVQTFNGVGHVHPQRWRATMSGCRTFWHFLLGVWIYLFALLAVL
jgi:cytochrome c oxidase subunit 3